MTELLRRGAQIAAAVSPANHTRAASSALLPPPLHQQSRPQRRRTDRIATCGGCDARWTGLAVAHCGACHATFTAVSAFDRHRRGGGCTDPAAAGLVRDDIGMWRHPGTWSGPSDKENA